MIYLSNAFSLNMVSVEDFTLIRARKVNPSDVPQNAISAIGHADTARVVSINDKIKVTKKGKIKITKNGCFF